MNDQINGYLKKVDVILKPGAMLNIKSSALLFDLGRSASIPRQNQCCPVLHANPKLFALYFHHTGIQFGPILGMHDGETVGNVIGSGTIVFFFPLEIPQPWRI